ncbi:hypothetical protein Moror_12674 [Moniliophthora roreri MCA 2997]|uniref:Uncharacterized protein n=1 Tax=Moniliophthora roreri (strain MCA 2997) TaxID=1381753 RepID=V2X8H5_MONRO|nr:hypothetical protein Moror_12674 [Moniliophthora roreri MCA 2997]
MSLSNLTDFSIGGGARIQNVEGDQYNDYCPTIIEARAVYVQGGTKLKGTRGKGSSNGDSNYDQFHNLIRGDLRSIKEFDSVSQVVRKWREDGGTWKISYEARRTIQIHTSKVRREKGRFTVVSYYGEDAQKEWRRDFRKFSQNQSPFRLQLFGINRSQVPALIFYDEMIPFAHVYKRGSLLADLCLVFFCDRLQCMFQELWIDSRRGHICSGLEGPDFETPMDPWRFVSAIPLTVELLKEDVAMRYISGNGDAMDWAMVVLARYQTQWHDFSNCDGCQVKLYGLSPDLLKDLRFDTAYSASLEPLARLQEGLCPKWELERKSYFSQCTNIENGLTRLRFDCTWQRGRKGGRCIWQLSWPRADIGWLTQCHSVFAAHKTPDGSERCPFMLSYEVWIQAEFDVFDSLSDFFQLCDEVYSIPRESRSASTIDAVPTDPSFVYLFLPMPPRLSTDMSTLQSWYLTFSQKYYWSSAANGETRLSEDECTHIGLPRLIPSLIVPKLRSWPKHVYDGLYKYQVARGFDPTTIQFFERITQCSEYRDMDPSLPLWEPVVSDSKSCSEEVKFENTSSNSNSNWSPWWKVKGVFNDIPAFGL